MSYADFLRTSTEYIHSWWENTCKGDAQMRAINHKVLLGLPHFGKRMKVVGDCLEPDPALECDETEAALEYQRELGWIEILRLRS